MDSKLFKTEVFTRNLTLSFSYLQNSHVMISYVKYAILKLNFNI